jgi:hypothetical protein
MKILAYDYEVKALPIDAGFSNVYGQHNANELSITICTGMVKQNQESTMIHEIIESINWQLGMHLKEEQIIRLEIGLYNTLKNAGIDFAPMMKELLESEKQNNIRTKK